MQHRHQPHAVVPDGQWLTPVMVQQNAELCEVMHMPLEQLEHVVLNAHAEPGRRRYFNGARLSAEPTTVMRTSRLRRDVRRSRAAPADSVSVSASRCNCWVFPASFDG